MVANAQVAPLSIEDTTLCCERRPDLVAPSFARENQQGTAAGEAKKSTTVTRSRTVDIPGKPVTQVFSYGRLPSKSIQRTRALLR